MLETFTLASAPVPMSPISFDGARGGAALAVGVVVLVVLAVVAVFAGFAVFVVLGPASAAPPLDGPPPAVVLSESDTAD